MTEEITGEELQALLDTDADVRIVDIRNRLSYDRRHIPGSELMPMNSLSEHVADLVDADAIVTVCQHGAASQHAVSLIRSYEGIDGETMVASLRGGIEDWDGELTSSE